jgi:hypothetical protein
MLRSLSSLALSSLSAKIAARGSAVLCLGMLSASIAWAQTTPVAYVYVQTSSGVIGYSAASNGALSKISGSPFKTVGLLAGSTGPGHALVSVGTHYIHAYKVGSNGAIGAQISQINTQLYPGGDCGPATAGQPGVLDHSGKYFYNFLSTFGSCSVYQTYNIASNGALSFNNYTRLETANGSPNEEETSMIEAILGNESYAYALEFVGHHSNILGFMREASGALRYIPIHEMDPSGVDEYDPQFIAEDPTNHLAAVVYPFDTAPGQVASYTADSGGNLTSTNTSSNAPFVDFSPTNAIAMSPSGLLLAVAGGDSISTPGVEVFHFNGANPPTKYKVVFTGVQIDEMKWDTSNHLYALSSSTQKLYVFTVTTTSITAAPGSPYAVGSGATALFVTENGRSSCSAPSTPGVHVCSPVNGSTVTSPVAAQAAGRVSGTLHDMELWVDGAKKFSTTASTLTTAVNLAPGTHRFSFLAINTAGQKWESTTYAAVK